LLRPNLRLIKKIQDEKENKKANRVDSDGQWEDFSEAALIDHLKGEREQEEEENGLVASSMDSDHDV
jgi:hypothetical protein